MLSAVASRFEENRELVESNRLEATRLIRETLFAETALTLDDVCFVQASPTSYAR